MLVLGPHGRVHERNDRFLSAVADTPMPATAPGRRAADRARTAIARQRATRPKPKPKGKPKKPAVTVKSVLSALRRRGSITAAQYSQTLRAFNGAVAAEKHLTGTRQTELEAVTESVHQLAASKQLTAPRLAAVVATLNANQTWWTTGSVPAPDQRIEFSGSQLVWQYYPGQGLQLQVLGTFGKANGMYTAGPSQYPAMEQLLSQMIPLASRRGGGTTWEYYFTFDGGKPPWTSAMSQATGLEALSRAYLATKNPYYLQVAASAMAVFGKPPPVGVTVPTTLGVRFLQYTFAPSLLIINADLQTLIGLDTYAQVSGNTTAQTLFAQGNAEAMAVLPSFNTGAWSLYSAGPRGRSELPRARDRLPAAAVHAHEGARLLHDRAAVHGRPDDPAGAGRSDAHGEAAQDVRAELPPVEGLARRDRRDPRYEHRVLDQRELRLRRQDVHGAGAEGRHLWRSTRRDRPGRELQPDHGHADRRRLRLGATCALARDGAAPRRP